MYLDAVRLRHDNAAELAKSADPGPRSWQIDWATSSDLDPRLHHKLHTGPMAAMAWGVVGGSPLVAVSVFASPERSDVSDEQLEVWDLRSGRLSPPRRLAASSIVFATREGDPVIVTGHESGLLRTWTVHDLSLLDTVETGGREIVQMTAVTSNGHPHVVALDAVGQIFRWRPGVATNAERFDVPRSNAIQGGRASDGQSVLIAAGGDGVYLWDVENGYETIPWPAPTKLRNLVSVVLTKSDERDLLTVLTALKNLVSFDLLTGEQTAAPIQAHENVIPNAPMHVWSPSGRRPQLAAVSGTLAVPTSWRVHLWNPNTSLPDKPPLSGPLEKSLVQSARWQDRDLLLTGSTGDGVVALWDLDVPAAPPAGHGERVSGLAVTGKPQIVVSVDEGGTIITRQGVDGASTARPLKTRTEGVHALATWTHHGALVAATGAGSTRFPDGKVRLWQLTTGRPELVIDTRAVLAHPFAVTSLGGESCLVTLGPPGELKVWRSVDGRLLHKLQTEIRSRVTGMTAGVVGGRPAVAVSAVGHPITLFSLDDTTAPAVRVPGTHDDLVVEIVDTRIVAGALGGDLTGWKTVRALNVDGDRLGPDITSEADVVAVTVASWPTAYIARTDGRVSLTDLETASDRCQPILLPRRPTAVAATADGGVVVGFGSDVAMLRSPTS